MRDDGCICKLKSIDMRERIVFIIKDGTASYCCVLAILLLIESGMYRVTGWTRAMSIMLPCLGRFRAVRPQISYPTAKLQDIATYLT